MRNVLEIDKHLILPERDDVLRAQGIDSKQDADNRIIDLAGQAEELFVKMCHPTGMFMSVSKHDFATIYEGSGENDDETPVADIYPDAGYLALFAVTAGAEVSWEISRRFAENDFALAAMLDSVASEAVDNCAQLLQDEYHNQLVRIKGVSDSLVSLRYSPGYCGWHISGQKKLFSVLRPDRIGILLSDTCLMQPLKSISGVILTGRAEIHIYEDNYPCCESCRDRSCLDRIERLKPSA